MIIARSPLRVTLGGGGTDLPSFYREHGSGFLVAAAIDKHVYVTMHRTYMQDMVLRYSKIELVRKVDEIAHPIIRHALQLLEIRGPNIEITSIADIPAGTGLGSSGSFTTALLKAAHKFKGEFIGLEDLAKQACHIELDLMREPIGKQDQYIAAFGGLTCFEFHADETVTARPLRISRENIENLNDRLLLFSTGMTRSASAILKEQKDKTTSVDRDMIDNLKMVKELGLRSCAAFEVGNLEEFGRIMHEHWMHKKKRSKNMSSESIDALYDLAMNNSAIGGKVIGAGGGGFLMFYAEDPMRLRRKMYEAGVEEMRFRFEFEGSKLLL